MLLELTDQLSGARIALPCILTNMDARECERDYERVLDMDMGI
jgi:hypothetical protein